MARAFNGPGAWCRGGQVPAAALSWPSLVLSSCWTDDAGKTRHVTRYRTPPGAQVWPAWLLVRPGWRRDDADRLLAEAERRRARGVVLNPEVGWAGVPDDAAAELVAYMAARAERVAVCSYPRTDFHPRFPWQGFATARVGLAETYANRGEAYSDDELAACLASWRAVGFDEVSPMVGMFDRSGGEPRLKTPAALAVDLAQRPASETLVWGPPSWPRAQSALLAAWGGGRPLPSQGGAGAVALALLAAGAFYALRGA